jgi:hypothetical protein
LVLWGWGEDQQDVMMQCDSFGVAHEQNNSLPSAQTVVLHCLLFNCLVSSILKMAREKSPSSMKDSIDAPQQLEHVGSDDRASLDGTGEDYSAISKRLNRKFDYHILPWLFGIW